MPQRENPNQSQTVPPPDAHQIASSNETLNTFLGGRTRSWMTGGPSAVTNPRPAPVAPSNSRKRNKKRKASDTAPPTQNDNDIERDNTPTDQSSEQLTGARETARYVVILFKPPSLDKHALPLRPSNRALFARAVAFGCRLGATLPQVFLIIYQRR